MSTQLLTLFQNENFIALNKPAGILTTPPRFIEKDARAVLGRDLQATLGQQVYPVHRLDYEVSGVVLFALNAGAHRAASLWFEKRQVSKLYLAITENQAGANPQQKFTWKAKVQRGKKRTYEHKAGKLSITKAEVLSSMEGGLLWLLSPVTGRPHQLRFDLSRHGFPIWGDQLYGSTKPWKENAIALQSVVLQFNEGDFLNWGLPAKIELPDTMLLSKIK